MPTKIRLQRHGKKGSAFYHIVVADSRAPRDGKYIARLGTYNPNTNPASIELNFDSALDWLNKGAQPTTTAKHLLSIEGILLKKHLQGGVKKGAFDQATAEKKFDAWVADKDKKKQTAVDSLQKAQADKVKARLVAETEAKEKKAAAILAKTSELTAEVTSEETPVADATTEEAATTEQTPSAEGEEKAE